MNSAFYKLDTVDWLLSGALWRVARQDVRLQKTLLLSSNLKLKQFLTPLWLSQRKRVCFQSGCSLKPLPKVCAFCGNHVWFSFSLKCSVLVLIKYQIKSGLPVTVNAPATAPCLLNKMTERVKTQIRDQKVDLWHAIPRQPHGIVYKESQSVKNQEFGDYCYLKHAETDG